MRECTQFKFEIKMGVRFYVKHTEIFEGARQYKWENRDCLYSMIYLNSCGKIFTSSAIRKHLKNM